MLNAERRIGLSLITTKLCDLLLSPKTTLPALLSIAGAPNFYSSILVPLRESGALLPQAFISQLLASHPKRHRAWRLGFISQIISLTLLLILGLNLQGQSAGIAVVVCLSIWSVSRAVCSLTNKDIQGKHIKKGQRGTLTGSAATISSTFSIVMGIIILLYGNLSKNADTTTIIILGVIAVSIQLGCLIIMWPLKTVIDVQDEQKLKQNEDDEASQNRVSKTLKSIQPKKLMNMSKTLKTFIIARSLMSNSALLAPMYTLAFAAKPISILPWLIIAQASAGFLSSYLWGKVADRSALQSMRCGALLAGISAFALFIILIAYPSLAADAWVVVGLFFLLIIGHNGVRTGRKIYSVDIAEEHDRTEFVAKSNTYVGSFILVAGALLSVLSLFSLPIVLGIMILLLSGGACLTFVLPTEK